VYIHFDSFEPEETVLRLLFEPQAKAAPVDSAWLLLVLSSEFRPAGDSDGDDRTRTRQGVANHGDRISNDLGDGDTITEHNTNLCFARSRTDSFRRCPQTVCLQAAAPSASDRSNVLFCCGQCDLDERNGRLCQR
jgi:hypothetical protein